MRYAVLLAAVWAGVACSQEEAPDNARGLAFNFAKLFIPPTLENPKSADFDDESDSPVVELLGPVMDEGDDTKIVIVSGIVRETNSFNAIVPSEWSVFMLHNENGYETVMIEHGERLEILNERGVRLLKTLRNDAPFAAGYAAFAPAFARERWSFNTAKEADVQKLADKYAAKSDSCANDEEKQEFSKGFLRAFVDSQKKALVK